MFTLKFLFFNETLLDKVDNHTIIYCKAKLVILGDRLEIITGRIETIGL